MAEGNGRSGNKDYAHFLAIARGSLYETITQLELAKGLGYVGGDSKSRSTLDEIYSLAEEVSRMLTSMLKKYGALDQKANHHIRSLFSCIRDGTKRIRASAEVGSRSRTVVVKFMRRKLKRYEEWI